MLGRRAYTFGDSYLAEVDIVLPASMSVAESHDIAEELQVCVHAQCFHDCRRFSIPLPACFIATTILHLICLFMRPSWVQWMACVLCEAVSPDSVGMFADQAGETARHCEGLCTH
jgi:hypothetical protein